MCRAVAVPCDGEEDDDQVRGVAREDGPLREPCARIGPRLSPSLGVRTRSGKGPGTRPGQASLLCADGRSRDSAREHEEADYVCRKQFPWPNSWVNDRDSTRPQRPPSYGIGRLTPSTRRPRRLPQTV
ncbi:hypothetical protein MTO96_001263 [Rhipicephalus appendiculatus]